MSFFLSNYLSMQRSNIKPLHVGFGFYGEEIHQRLGNIKVNEDKIKSEEKTKVTNLENSSIVNPIQPDKKIDTHPEKKEIETSKKSNYDDSSAREFNKNIAVKSIYYVNPFFAFLAWTIDAILGFCFLIISLCINYVFIPKGLFVISPAFEKYISFLALDINVVHTFLFSLQVWFFMAFLVFLFQYTILGFEGSTLGRWIFGIAIQNNKNKEAKVSEKTKICAALSESLLLGGILSFIFVIISPSRVPIFFWMRYSSKK